jgi:hypothetical protein
MRLAWLALAGCAGTFDVPTARMPITWHEGRHGYYEKGGVDVDDGTCGDRLQRAVESVPAAEQRMIACRHETDVSFAAMVGGLAIGGAGIATGSTRWDAIGGAVGVSLFVFGFVLARYALGGQDDAVHRYNGAL